MNYFRIRLTSSFEESIWPRLIREPRYNIILYHVRASEWFCFRYVQQWKYMTYLWDIKQCHILVLDDNCHFIIISSQYCTLPWFSPYWCSCHQSYLISTIRHGILVHRVRFSFLSWTTIFWLNTSCAYRWRLLTTVLWQDYDIVQNAAYPFKFWLSQAWLLRFCSYLKGMYLLARSV